MHDLILYNYKLSPFSEKIRMMLGYSDLAWHSVTVAAMPPRPELAALTGGYRKIPVAQIGADVYCDTKTIAAEIARLSGKPELALQNCSADAQAFAQHADSKVFLAVTATCLGGILRTLWRETSTITVLRFIKDRMGIARHAKVPPLVGKRAEQLLQAHLSDMEQRLTADFLFGDTPCAADFSAAFGLWFAALGGNVLPEPGSRVAHWYARMQAFGHGNPQSMSLDTALSLAHDSQPAALAKSDKVEPKTACIAPQDYARDPTVGELVAESDRRWVLAHEHPRVGLVHVHFPKTGFELR